MTKYLTRAALAAHLLLFLGAYSETSHSEDIPSISAKRAIELSNTLNDVMERHQINTAAIAVIKDGVVVWSNHYGQQSPNVPASAQTL